MLRDRRVCGINDEKIQNCLLSETRLTYQKALSLSQSLETAAKNVKELQKKQPSEESSWGGPGCRSEPGGRKEAKTYLLQVWQGRSLSPHMQTQEGCLPSVWQTKTPPSCVSGQAKETRTAEQKDAPKESRPSWGIDRG